MAKTEAEYLTLIYEFITDNFSEWIGSDKEAADMAVKIFKVIVDRDQGGQRNGINTLNRENDSRMYYLQ